jgi:hypothetical protein
MPSLEHEAPLEVIRQQPEVVADLLRRVLPHLRLPARVTGALGSADMSQVAPTQYVADMVVVLADQQTSKPVLAVVIEPQGRDRKTKKVSWPVYVTTAIKANRVPRAILVVLCWDPREAARCRRVIATGHPGFDLYPIVVDPSTFPDWRDAGPYLTILAGATKAIDLGTPSGRDAVLAAIEQTGASHADTAALTTIILGVADAAARRELEALMASSKFRSTFVDGLLQQGEERGLEKGREKGREEGREEGAVTSKVEDLVKVIKARGLHLTKAQLELVTSCADLSRLATWFDRALDGKTTDEIFGPH